MPKLGRNRQKLEDSLKHLATGPHHAALIEMCRTLADVVDGHWPGFDDKAWREYRLNLGNLMEATDGSGDESDDFLESLRAPMGDTADT